MSLPGKYCIGILEEDNPQKSYFCFKPLLVEEEGGYVPFDSQEVYPENGCIRIVPDKNESSHFKARMRRIGLFAAVDLRDHPGANDKIRMNKNYHGDGVERNAHIIYSDVVRDPEPDSIFALLDLAPEEADNAPLADTPCVPRVLLRPEGALQENVYNVTCEEGQDVPRLCATDAKVDLDKAQVFSLEGFAGHTLSIAILPPPPKSEPRPLAEPRAPRPAEPRPLAESQPPVEPAPVAEAPAPQPAPSPEPTAPEPASPQQDKPWITRTDFAQPKMEAGMPPMDRALAMQCGINPRRGRSLQEVIDDKWKHSRLEQLGHAVPDLVTKDPVDSPADRAVAALKGAWARRDQRQTLVDAIVQLEGAQIAMDARRNALKQSAINDQLNELEAQRLEMLDDMEKLKHASAEVRDALKKEIRQDEADAFADAVAKTRQAQEEQARWDAEAEKSRVAAEGVQDALNALADGRFEARLREYALNSRAAEMLRRLDAPVVKVEPPAGESASADELVHRLRMCGQDAGCPISHTDAVNLLVCASQGLTLVSGAQGSGKTTMIRLLARTLGAEQDMKLIPPGTSPLEAAEPGSAVRVVLLDDLNLAKNADPLRALWPAAQDTLLCATAQDDGEPLPAHLLGRAFLIRLADEPSDAPWMPRSVSPAKEYPRISAEALRKAFEPRMLSLPAHVLKRMEKLRADLTLVGIKLSRGALTALWRYCAAAIPLMPLEPSAVLDLALAQRAMPVILATAPLDALKSLPAILADLPRCRTLLEQPLPIDLG